MGDDQLVDLELYGLITKGGIEDTTFEAKAKDSEKFRGQGPTFRRGTLIRGTLIVHIAQTVYVLHHRKYIAI